MNKIVKFSIGFCIPFLFVLALVGCVFLGAAITFALMYIGFDTWYEFLILACTVVGIIIGIGAAKGY